MIADAFAALKVLAAHPKVDAKRIASLAADLAAIPPTSQPSNKYVRSLRRATSCRSCCLLPRLDLWRFGRTKRLYRAPVLLLFGEKDELTSPKKVKPYLEFLEQRQSKAPLETITYPGAYHAWSNPSAAQVKFLPTHGSTRNCPMIVIGPGHRASSLIVQRFPSIARSSTNVGARVPVTRSVLVRKSVRNLLPAPSASCGSTSRLDGNCPTSPKAPNTVVARSRLISRCRRPCIT